ncbi:MAG: hypothetical protein AAGG79_01670 [Pseudomonadota bacterium]
MRFLLATFTLLAGLGATAFAAESSEAQRALIPNTNIESLRPVLQDAGLTPEQVTLGGGADSLVIRSNGLVMIMQPTVCSPDCAGLRMYALFGGTSAAPVMNNYNSSTPPTVVFSDGGNTVLSRYLIADHGMTVGSFIVNVKVFENTLRKWQTESDRAAAQSVGLSLDAPSAEVSYERENAELLGEMMRRPELYSQAGPRSY